MEVRDAFAMAAMQGDWSAQDDVNGMFLNTSDQKYLEDRARLYYRMADAMLKIRHEPRVE